MAKYVVKVDDNYHHGSLDIYEAGSFDTLEEAFNLCIKITIESLRSLYKQGITPDELDAQWAMFGEDPFIYTGKGDVLFSARNFITDDLCNEIVQSMDSGEKNES